MILCWHFSCCINFEMGLLPYNKCEYNYRHIIFMYMIRFPHILSIIQLNGVKSQGQLCHNLQQNLFFSIKTLHRSPLQPQHACKLTTCHSNRCKSRVENVAWIVWYTRLGNTCQRGDAFWGDTQRERERCTHAETYKHVHKGRKRDPGLTQRAI